MKSARPYPSFRAALSGWSWAVAFLGSWLTAHAQVAVTSVDYGTFVDTANVTSGNVTYLNQSYTVDSVSTASGAYNLSGPTASNVYFRRNTSSGNSNNTTVFYSYSSTTSTWSGTTATVLGEGDSTPTAAEVMLSSNLSQGLRNPFANTGDSSSLTTNIERIDFYFAGGYTVQAGDALVFFDLENYGDYGDGFRIAAYNTVGTVNGVANAPTTYANTGLLIQPDTLGNAVQTPGGTNARYIRSTTTNGDNLSSNQSIGVLDSNSGTPSSNDLYLVGLVIPLSDLGLIVGQTISGYSLFAGDVKFTNTNQMVNWNNTRYYPTDTSADSWGNVDFMGFGAQFAQSAPVPEPSVYGAALVGVGLLALGLRRHRGRRGNAAA